MSDVSTTSWSEVDASNSQQPPEGWPAGMFPNAVEGAARMNMGALKRFWNRNNPVYAPSLSTTDTYILNPTQALLGYGLYEEWRLRFPHANTSTSPTINLSSLGPQPIRKYSASSVTALASADIQARDHTIWWDGTEFILHDPNTTPFQFINSVFFSTSDTYVPSANLKYCDVTLTAPGGNGGQGGNGGGNSGASGGSGGAGETRFGTFTAAQIGASVPISIGTPGVNSAFGALLTAVTGNNGTSASTQSPGDGGAGGTGGSGGHGVPGGAGSPGMPATNNTPNAVGVTGGASYWGGGGKGGVQGTAGTTATVPGSGGGSGGGSLISSPAGGSGAPGYCQIKEYI